MERLFASQEAINPVQAAAAAQSHQAEGAAPARPYTAMISWRAQLDLDPGPIQEARTKHEWRTWIQKFMNYAAGSTVNGAPNESLLSQLHTISLTVTG